MKAQTAIAMAAAALLSGGTAASAADMPSSDSGMAVNASDTLSLNAAQQKTAWNDINKKASNQNAPANFNAAPGVVVPTTLKISAVPSKAARDVPSLRP